MQLRKIEDQWWIVGCPDDWKQPDLPGIGPYATRWDAEGDKEGLEKYEDWEPRHISVDSPLARRRKI